MRSVTGGAAVAAAPALAAALAGCGSTNGAKVTASGSGSPGGVASPGGPASPAAAGPKASLVITVRANATAAPVRWTLICDPDGGTHPDAAAACAALRRAKDPFAPVPRGVMCPMIVGGPQTATITGTWNGEPVDAVFSKRDGCQTGRWDRIGPVFGSVGAANGANGKVSAVGVGS
jgi:Subtilisin inhibitor-like